MNMKLKKSVLFLTALASLGGVATTVYAALPQDVLDALTAEQRAKYESQVVNGGLSATQIEAAEKVIVAANERGILNRVTPDRIDQAVANLRNQPDDMLRYQMENIPMLLDQMLEAGKAGTLDLSDALELKVVHRLMNPISLFKVHVYTINTFEVADLLKRGWKYECAAFNYADNGIDIHRLYSGDKDGQHLYTADTNERDSLVQKGWKYEGVAWKVPNIVTDESAARLRGPQSNAVFRMWNKANGGEHLFTQNWNEVELAERNGWVYEQIAWFTK